MADSSAPRSPREWGRAASWQAWLGLVKSGAYVGLPVTVLLVLEWVLIGSSTFDSVRIVCMWMTAIMIGVLATWAGIHLWFFHARTSDEDQIPERPERIRSRRREFGVTVDAPTVTVTSTRSDYPDHAGRIHHSSRQAFSNREHHRKHHAV